MLFHGRDQLAVLYIGREISGLDLLTGGLLNQLGVLLRLIILIGGVILQGKLNAVAIDCRLLHLIGSNQPVKLGVGNLCLVR